MQIIKLEKQHNRKSFDCGNPLLNRFLQQQASQVSKRNEAVIYVACKGNEICGFYTLSSAQIERAFDPTQLKKQSPHTPIPCVLIGRLAVDHHYQGQGLGTDLLAHALITVARLAQQIGIAYVVIDAKDAKASAYYQRFGFFELQHQPLRLCYPVQAICDTLLDD